jgi:hypothetical protein
MYVHSSRHPRGSCRYLWYLLRERKFDQEAVDDLVQLRGALQLSDTEVAEALKERSQVLPDTAL